MQTKFRDFRELSQLDDRTEKFKQLIDFIGGKKNLETFLNHYDYDKKTNGSYFSFFEEVKNEDQNAYGMLFDLGLTGNHV